MIWPDETVPVGTGEWSHVAFTYSTATGKEKFYFNGARAGSTVHEVAMTGSGEDLRVRTSKYRDKYKGAIDQLAIFNRALTPEEVSELLLGKRGHTSFPPLFLPSSGKWKREIGVTPFALLRAGSLCLSLLALE